MDVKSNQMNNLQTKKWYKNPLRILIVILVLCILLGLGYLKLFQKEGLKDSNDNDAEQKLRNRLNEKMTHKGYSCYAIRRVAGSLSGPRQLANGNCNKDYTCACKKINCGARNNVKTQVLALLSENEITQDQADRFITNLDLNHSNCM